MAIDYSFAPKALQKPRVKALEKEDKDAARDAKDKRENTKAKKRAKGRCEVWTAVIGVGAVPCDHKDTATHHLIGGIGRRNRGKSILAEYKLRVCTECHAAITANILRPTTAEHTAKTVMYWSAR
jgi:hypothetical protein